MSAAILHNGRAVKTDGFDQIRYSINGYLSSFETNDGRYVFITRQYFRDEPNEQFAVDSYYYEVSAYADHIKDPQTYTLADLNKSYRFKFTDAEEGSILEVGIIDVDISSPDFYKKSLYTFNHVYGTTYRGERNGVLNTTNMGSGVSIVSEQSEVANKFFENHRIGQENYVTAEEAEVFLETLIRTALWVGSVNREIFPIIQNNSQNCSEVNDLVNTMQQQWVNGSLFSQVTVETINDYRISLYTLYRNVFKNQVRIKSAICEEKLTTLFKVIPLEGLSIIPFSTKKLMLEQYARLSEIYDEDEALVNRILYSVKTPEDADLLLDYMLVLRDGVKTNFEVFFRKIDDDRLARYTFGISLQGSHRKHFVNALYQAWKISKYDITYIPSDVTKNADGYNPESFFMRDEGLQYYEGVDSVFEHYSTTSNEGSFTVTKTISYVPEINLDKNLVTLKKLSLFESNLNPNKLEDFAFQPPIQLITDGNIDRALGRDYWLQYLKSLKPKETELQGKYHIYQPITLIGYTADLELVIPNKTTVPAFLYYYAVDFDRLQEIDETLSLILEIGLEVGIFFLTGGVSAIKSLRHLKHFSKVGRALGIGQAIPGTEKVLVWRGIDGISEVVSFSASVVSSSADYVAANENDEDRKKIAEGISFFFMLLSLASGGTAAFSRYRTIKAADDVLFEMNALTTRGIAHNVPDDVRDAIKAVSDFAAFELAEFGNKLNALPVTETNKLFQQFELFPPSAKSAFFREHGLVGDINFWNKLNENDAELLTKWKTLFHGKIDDRLLKSFISDKQLVDGIIKYYDEPVLREALEKPLDITTRREFLKSFGDPTKEVFDGFKQRPHKIQEWKNATSGEKTLAIDYDYLWSRSGLDLAEIRDLNHFVFEIRTKILEDHQFAIEWIISDLPEDKVKALKYLRKGQMVSIGNYIEAPAKSYISKNLLENQVGFVDIDIRFFDKNGNLLNNGKFRDIDGLIFNRSTNKFEHIISCKFPEFATKRQEEINFLLSYAEMPNENTSSLLSYLSSKEYLANKTFKGKNKAFSYKIQMTNVSTRQKIKMNPSEFSSKVNDSYQFSEVIEINPRTFEIDEQEFIEGIYIHLRKR